MKVLFICVNWSHFVQPAEYSEFCFKYGDIVINLALRPLFGFNNFNFSPTQDDKHCTFVLFNRSLIVIRITRESDVCIFHLVSETKENVQFEKTTIHHIEFRRTLSVTEKESSFLCESDLPLQKHSLWYLLAMLWPCN